MGLVGSRYLFAGSWLSLVPWAIVGLLIGYWSEKREWAINGSCYGFALSFVFMVAGYTGSASLISRLPFFAMLGGFCGLILAWLGFTVKKIVNKQKRLMVIDDHHARTWLEDTICRDVTNNLYKESKMRKLTMGQGRLAAWAGIIGPALFVAIFTIEGWLRPGYGPLSTYVSALSLGPRGWIQIANFIILGVLMLVFTRGIAAEFQNGKASRGGPILLAIIAILFIVSGPLVMDPTGTPLNQVTIHGTIHGLAGGIIFILMPISCFVFLRRFRVDPKWQALQWWTLALGVIVAAAVVLLTISSKLPEVQNVFKDWLGLIQRTIIVPYMLWLFLFGLGLRRRIEQG